MPEQNRFGQSALDEADARKIAKDYKRHFPLADEDAIEAGMRVARTHAAQTAALVRRFGELGLDISVPRHFVLRVLHFAEDAKTLNDIRAELGVTSGAVTSLIDGLEQDGMVVRAPHPIDRRATVVRLTERGRRAADAMVAEIPGFFETLFRGFSRDEKRMLNEWLERLQRNAHSSYGE